MKKEWFILSKQKIKSLISFYIILFFVGLCFTLLALLYERTVLFDTMSISFVAIIGGCGTALIGCSIFYLRKLYKACINNEMSPPTNDNDKIREIGVSAYYYLRPLFSIGFSILIHMALKSSVLSITVKETQLNEGFIYMSMFLSFFAGFAAGDFITYLQDKSVEWVTKTFKY